MFEKRKEKTSEITLTTDKNKNITESSAKNKNSTSFNGSTIERFQQEYNRDSSYLAELRNRNSKVINIPSVANDTKSIFTGTPSSRNDNL